MPFENHCILVDQNFASKSGGGTTNSLVPPLPKMGERAPSPTLSYVIAFTHTAPCLITFAHTALYQCTSIHATRCPFTIARMAPYPCTFTHMAPCQFTFTHSELSPCKFTHTTPYPFISTHMVQGLFRSIAWYRFRSHSFSWHRVD